MKCNKCERKVTEKVKQFSEDKFGKILCFECQKEQFKPKEQEETKKDVKEERKLVVTDKDKLIVRQVAMKCACEIASMKQVDIKELATEIERWILR